MTKFGDPKRLRNMSTHYHNVGWFEIPVSDMGRAKAFYEYVFQVELEEHKMGEDNMAWFPMLEQAPGATGTLMQGPDYEPSSKKGVMIYFSVLDVDLVLDRAREKEAKILREKFSIGEYGFVAIFLDSEGNRIGLHARP